VERQKEARRSKKRKTRRTQGAEESGEGEKESGGGREGEQSHAGVEGEAQEVRKAEGDAPCFVQKGLAASPTADSLVATLASGAAGGVEVAASSGPTSARQRSPSGPNIDTYRTGMHLEWEKSHVDGGRGKENLGSVGTWLLVSSLENLWFTSKKTSLFKKTLV